MQGNHNESRGHGGNSNTSTVASNGGDSSTSTSIRDCTECRITGVVMFTGIAAYTYLQRAKIPVQDLSRRRFMGAVSGFFLAVAVARALV